MTYFQSHSYENPNTTVFVFCHKLAPHGPWRLYYGLYRVYYRLKVCIDTCETLPFPCAQPLLLPLTWERPPGKPRGSSLVPRTQGAPPPVAAPRKERPRPWHLLGPPSYRPGWGSWRRERKTSSWDGRPCDRCRASNLDPASRSDGKGPPKKKSQGFEQPLTSAAGKHDWLIFIPWSCLPTRRLRRRWVPRLWRRCPSRWFAWPQGCCPSKYQGRHRKNRSQDWSLANHHTGRT